MNLIQQLNTRHGVALAHTRQRSDDVITGWVANDWPWFQKSYQYQVHLVLIDDSDLFMF